MDAPHPPDPRRADLPGSADVERPFPESLDRWSPADFRAPLWARNAHVQTVAGKLLRPEPRLELRREVWETPDGDELVLDFAPPPRAAREAPTVVVLHGLEGNARRRYALGLYGELTRRGLRAVGLNFRGCARCNRTARAYHSGETGDLRFVLERLREGRADPVLAAVGFSLGGNVLLKFLGEMRDEGRDWLRAAVAVSVPYDLDAGARALEESFMGRRYAGYFLDSLLAKVRLKRHLLRERVDVERGLASTTIREFDERVTAPLHGFRDAAHYYAESSSGPGLSEIRVPTLLVHARDDPFLPWERVPVRAVRGNPWLVPAFTDRGGHVGFLEGPPWAARPWAEAVAADFLATALGGHRPDPPGHGATETPLARREPIR